MSQAQDWKVSRRPVASTLPVKASISSSTMPCSQRLSWINYCEPFPVKVFSPFNCFIIRILLAIQSMKSLLTVASLPSMRSVEVRRMMWNPELSVQLRFDDVLICYGEFSKREMVIGFMDTGNASRKTNVVRGRFLMSQQSQFISKIISANRFATGTKRPLRRKNNGDDNMIQNTTVSKSRFEPASSSDRFISLEVTRSHPEPSSGWMVLSATASARTRDAHPLRRKTTRGNDLIWRESVYTAEGSTTLSLSTVYTDEDIR